MTIQKKDIKYVGYSNFSNGVSSSVDPSLLPDGYSGWATNVRFRGGLPRTRPPIINRGLLPSGKFQGAHFLSVSQGMIITSIDGRIYRHKIPATTIDTHEITPKAITTVTSNNFHQPAIGASVTITVDDTSGLIEAGAVSIGDNQYYIQSITSAIQFLGVNIGNTDADGVGVNIPTGTDVYYIDVNPRHWNLAYMEQAGDFLIIQDGYSKPIIYDGSTSFRASETQVPIGTCMAFGNGRLWVAIKNTVKAGDLFGISAMSHLSFTDDTYLAEGGTFSTPETITAMKMCPRLDNTTETGDLFVFTTNTTTTIKSTVYDRTTWKDTPGMQRILFPAIGCEGQRSLCSTNQDIIFRSKDGWRSIRNTYVDQQDFSNIPMSIDMDRITRYDSDNFLKYLSCVIFDNRILFTANPRYKKFEHGFSNYKSGYNICANKILSLDLAPIAYSGSSKTPSWDGEWTGINPCQYITGRFSGKDRLFIISSDDDGENRLYEILKEGDQDYFESNLDIPCSIEFKSTPFETPNLKKKLNTSKIFFSGIKDTIAWNLQYKPDEYQCFQDWDSGSACAITKECNIFSGCIPKSFKTGYKYPIATSEPPEVCNDYTGRLMNDGYKFQIKLSWTGQVRLDGLILSAQVNEDTLGGEHCIDEALVCKEILCCENNDYSFTDESIEQPQEQSQPQGQQQ